MGRRVSSVELLRVKHSCRLRRCRPRARDGAPGRERLGEVVVVDKNVSEKALTNLLDDAPQKSRA